MQSVGQHWIWHESGVPCHWVSGQLPGTQNESTPMNIKNVAVALVTLIASSAAQAQQAVQWRVEESGEKTRRGGVQPLTPMADRVSLLTTILPSSKTTGIGPRPTLNTYLPEASWN